MLARTKLLRFLGNFAELAGHFQQCLTSLSSLLNVSLTLGRALSSSTTSGNLGSLMWLCNSAVNGWNSVASIRLAKWNLLSSNQSLGLKVAKAVSELDGDSGSLGGNNHQGGDQTELHF